MVNIDRWYGPVTRLLSSEDISQASVNATNEEDTTKISPGVLFTFAEAEVADNDTSSSG
jgi:hypothetical protein